MGGGSPGGHPVPVAGPRHVARRRADPGAMGRHGRSPRSDVVAGLVQRDGRGSFARGKGRGERFVPVAPRCRAARDGRGCLGLWRLARAHPSDARRRDRGLDPAQRRLPREMGPRSRGQYRSQASKHVTGARGRAQPEAPHLARGRHPGLLLRAPGVAHRHRWPGSGNPHADPAFYFDTTGRWQPYPVYQKHFLVPIVERVPFIPPRWLQLKWFGGFGIGRGLPLYASPLGRFGVMICYESAFESLARGYRESGAEFLVNITNDAWYGRTAGPYQHAAHLVMRAIETRAGIARAANDGISELVDPLGRTSIETGLEQEAAVAGVLRTSDVIPLYVRWGDWVGTLVVLVTLGLAGVLAVAKWRAGRI
ncbi:MAG: hypothetical protein DMD67_01685 [Gemmatimonadetes bacterium]|nr:MAG: hypothetical protein DMD67_01685 [Gemmatimonadota bacterium]